jgi:hypothetical protein
MYFFVGCILASSLLLLGSVLFKFISSIIARRRGRGVPNSVDNENDKNNKKEV